ncbi:hypothetical protein ACS0TY_033439 [Phlomoides rotata]
MERIGRMEHAPDPEEVPHVVQMDEAKESDVDGEEREMLKLHLHTNKFLKWTFTIDQSTLAWRDLVWDIGMLTSKIFCID